MTHKRMLGAVLFLAILLSTACQTKPPQPVTTPPVVIPGDVLSAPLIEDKEEPLESSATSGDIWDEVRKGFTFKKYWNNPEVDKQVKWYANQPRYFQRMSVHAARYIQYVLAEAKKENIPTEMLILPMIESGYDPFVHSPSGAAGIWQFVPATGKLYGMKKTANYDGRKDIIASTEGAMQYLKQMNADFNGDWLLTLAAYNAGERAIQNAVASNKRQGKKTDYFSLSLRKETSMFVPHLLALAKIIDNPKKYGITLLPISNRPYFTQLNAPHMVNLNTVAAQIDVDPTELKLLNPGYNNVTSKETNQRLLVPEARTKKALAVINNVAVAEEPATDNKEVSSKKSNDLILITTYTVAPNDTLWDIAKHFHVTVAELEDWNHLGSHPKLHLEQKLYINKPAPKTKNKPPT